MSIFLSSLASKPTVRLVPDWIINSILDMRLPLTFSPEDCKLIATIIGQEVERKTPLERNG